jgi:hypothetical protein
MTLFSPFFLLSLFRLFYCFIVFIIFSLFFCASKFGDDLFL